MGPFSFTGQPNAMGGREVGGLANQLAAHMDIENAEHRDCVQSFWQSPHIPDKQGLKAVDLFEAIHEGSVKAVWIMATNPAVSLPDSHRVRKALEKCDCVIVSDCVSNTDTIHYADIKLPALTWGARNGTVTNSDRTISRQRPFVPAPGEAKPDWQIVTEVAHKMGYADSFPYQTSFDVFREHAALSGYRNQGQRCFDISGLSELSAEQFDVLEPIQWPVDASPFESSNGRFFTASRKARFIPVVPTLPASELSTEFPFTLNTGRVRDHWHTLTRTGVSARLSQHSTSPTVALNPEDAQAQSIQEGDLVRVFNQLGELRLLATTDSGLRQGDVFVPIHWTEQFAQHAVVSHVIPPVVDPFSGQPESKHAVVNVERLDTHWQGFVISRRQIELSGTSHWYCQKVDQAWYYGFRGDQTSQDW
ncbi:UNVERIFIED_CONTAM: hypothetical protein GTU68_055681, partial [Idotea baltica]|nr:hypothetical protein [Idotea baltica]